MNIRDCTLCPRKCHVDRRRERGYCGAGERAKVALVSLHPWEEPCLTGTKGAGTVFFSHCSLRCCYCQNHEISHEGRGVEVSDERLAEIFLEQQGRGAETLDLVTPSHYVPQILKALDMAREQGFSLPVVYNSSGYETPETVEALRGYVDIFLPDLKYRHEKSASEYSKAPDYFSVAGNAIRQMVDQVGPCLLDGAGRMKRGVLVRHLVLPGCRHESMEILDWLWGEFGDRIHISLMNQYTPMFRAGEHRNLSRRLTTFEYESVVEHALSLGITRCYVQERRASSGEYVPTFDGSGVRKTLPADRRDPL